MITLYAELPPARERPSAAGYFARVGGQRFPSASRITRIAQSWSAQPTTPAASNTPHNSYPADVDRVSYRRPSTTHQIRSPVRSGVGFADQ